VRAKQVDLEIDKSGHGMKVRFPYPEEDGGKVTIEGQFCGLVKPEECSWVIDEVEGGQRCICLSLMKRARTTQESTWWSRLFTSEEETGMPDLPALRVSEDVQRGPTAGEEADER